MEDSSSGFALSTRIGLPYEQAVEAAISALKEEGFGVLTQIDVKATLWEKLNADFRSTSSSGRVTRP